MWTSSLNEFPQFNHLQDCRYGKLLYNIHDIYIGRAVQLYGEYSELEIELFKSFIRPGNVVIDVGANIGAHALYFAKSVGSKGLVLAFEPQRVVFQTLCANMALNSLTNAHCLQAALGAQNGFIKVPPLNYNQDNNFGGLSLEGQSKGEQVSIMKLDNFNLPTCDFIKIDVEGMEHSVLQGAANLIEQFKPPLYLENDRQTKAAELIGLIDSMGYNMYWHKPPLYNPNNFLKNTNNVFGKIASINMLCLHKSKDAGNIGLEKVSCFNSNV